MLIGIVLRGSHSSFQSYGGGGGGVFATRAWSRPSCSGCVWGGCFGHGLVGAFEMDHSLRHSWFLARRFSVQRRESSRLSVNASARVKGLSQEPMNDRNE